MGNYAYGVSKRTHKIAGVKVANGIFFGKEPNSLKNVKKARVYHSFLTRCKNNAEEVADQDISYVLTGDREEGEQVVAWDGRPVFDDKYIKENSVGRLKQKENRRYDIEWDKTKLNSKSNTNAA